MRALALLALALLGLATPAAAARMVTDSAGRQITLPDRIERVFAAGPPASVLVYVLAPEKLAGWSRAATPAERDYLAAPYGDLPELGRLTGRGDTANLEVVLSVKPDLILDFGSISDTYVSLAGRVQDQTGIPYLLIDGRFANTAEALRLTGDILGVSERGAELAAYAEATFAGVDAALARIPAEARPRVYLARGPDGLETGLRGSINAEIIERVGAINVADGGSDRQGIAQVQLEQILAWNPDAIVTWDDRFYQSVRNDPAWAGIAAIEAGRVALSPGLPFGWIDRPPSLNRLIGLKWLAGLFYPDQAPTDLRAETREFYRLFYQVDLDEAWLDRLLGPAGGTAP
jgi:iron complex transport system substrate-binding protein